MSRKDLRRCDCCLVVKANLMKCGKCENVYYCSRKCQKKAWAQHKNVCGCKLPKGKKSVVCTVHEDRKPLRALVKQMHANVTPEQHCQICGDINSQCDLVRTVIGILCTDCEDIQLNAPPEFFDRAIPAREEVKLQQEWQATFGVNVRDRSIKSFSAEQMIDRYAQQFRFWQNKLDTPASASKFDAASNYVRLKAVEALHGLRKTVSTKFPELEQAIAKRARKQQSL